MKRFAIVLIVAIGILLLPEVGVAQKRIVINSNPAGADVWINNAPTRQQTPAVIKNPGKKSFVVVCKKKEL